MGIKVDIDNEVEHILYLANVLDWDLTGQSNSTYSQQSEI